MAQSTRFEGKRLRLAREFRGLTLENVGGEIASSRQFVQQLESGARQPNEDTVGALAEALRFPAAFFYRELQAEVTETQCNFRSRRNERQGVRRRIATYATLFLEILHYLNEYVELPQLKLPSGDVRSRDRIEKLAERCRDTWGLGVDKPIKNVTRVLENAGVVVATFDGFSQRTDALSVRYPVPFVIRNTEKGSSSRARFDLSHECGHLIMHKPSETGSMESEAAADVFASALLLPRQGFGVEFAQSGFSWPAIFRLKERWGASAAAIVRRAYDLRLISPLQYRRANTHIRMRGWHKGEPGEPVPEMPEVIPSAFVELGKAFRLTPRDVADNLALDYEVFASVTGISVQGVSAGRVATRIVPLDAFRRKP